MTEELEGPPEQPKVFPFNEMGERWELGGEMFIKPDSTWAMTRSPYTYDYSRYSYTQHGLEDLRDLKKDDVIIVESGMLIEVERHVHFGKVAHKFPMGQPRYRGPGPYDIYGDHPMLSCDCKYLLRIVGAIQSQYFARRTFDRTVRVKYEGRAMIDGWTRHIVRNEEMLKVWTRDFQRIYGG